MIHRSFGGGPNKKYGSNTLENSQNGGSGSPASNWMSFGCVLSVRSDHRSCVCGVHTQSIFTHCTTTENGFIKSKFRLTLFLPHDEPALRRDIAAPATSCSPCRRITPQPLCRMCCCVRACVCLCPPFLPPIHNTS
jgi:hypothetical protein